MAINIPSRFGLAWLMTAIALIAFAFTCLGVAGGSVAVVVFGLATVPITSSPPGQRLGAWAWVCSLYPTLVLGSLYLTWGSAWGFLGHQPRPVSEPPARLGPVVAGVNVVTQLLLFGIPFSFLGSFFLSVADSKRRFLASNGSQSEALRPAVGPILWALAFAIYRWDPFRVLAWFLA